MSSRHDVAARAGDQPADLPLEGFRVYLQILAQQELRRPLRDRLHASDIVQQTLLEAHHHRGQFRGESSGELAAWLRKILARQLLDAEKAMLRTKRDVRRERSLEQSLSATSLRLAAWLTSETSTPSQNAMQHERSVQLATALSQLPAAQQQALLLKHCEGRSLSEIAAELGRTPEAVAGLLKRGLRQLRALLPTEG